MTMKTTLPLLAMIAAGAVLFASSVDAKTPYDAGLSVAKKRGYTGEQRACYARVFARHASPNRRGHWSAPV